MRSLLAFLKPSWKKMVLPLTLILLPWVLILTSIILPSSWTTRLAFLGLFGLLELPLQILNSVFNLSLSRGSGSDWLSFNLYASTWQGFLLVSLLYGLFGYLLSCLCICVFRTTKPLIIVLVVLISSLLFLAWWLYRGAIFNVVDRAGSCQVDADCVVAIDISGPCVCPAAYSLIRFRKDQNLIPYEFGKDYSKLIRQNSGVICEICPWGPLTAVCSKEKYCQLPQSGNTCTKDSDCPEGLVCVGRGPTQPSPEIPGVCLSAKQSQGVQ